MGNTVTSPDEECGGESNIEISSQSATKDDKEPESSFGDVLLENYEDQIENLRLELDEIRNQRYREHCQFLLDKEKFERGLEEGTVKLSTTMASNVQKFGVPPHEYTECVKSARRQDKAIQSSYVVSLESQLCRSSHVMGIFMHQLSLMKAHFEILLHYMRLTIVHLTDEKSKIEVQLLNKIYATDEETKSMREEYERRVEEHDEELVRISKLVKPPAVANETHQKDDMTNSTSSCPSSFDDNESQQHVEEEEKNASFDNLISLLEKMPGPELHDVSKFEGAVDFRAVPERDTGHLPVTSLSEEFNQITGVEVV